MRNNVKMRLHPDPLWDLNIDAGAAKITFDLVPTHRSPRSGGGAASIEVRLGSRADTTKVNIETGASSVHVYVPSDAACELRTESALSSKHIRGFENKGDGLYRSDNFDSAVSESSSPSIPGLSSITSNDMTRETGDRNSLPIKTPPRRGFYLFSRRCVSPSRLCS